MQLIFEFAHLCSSFNVFLIESVSYQFSHTNLLVTLRDFMLVDDLTEHTVKGLVIMIMTADEMRWCWVDIFGHI